MNVGPKGELTVKPVFKARRALLASLIAAATIASTGCSSGGGFSLASMNPFSKPQADAVQENAETSGITTSVASMTDKTRQGITTFGASARNAVGKTTGAVASVFRKPAAASSESDELSLSNKPDKVNAEVYIANGQLWESSGDLTKAMESYTKALESEPTNAPALSSIARLNFRQGKFQQANEFFTRALAQSPNDAELHNDIGLTRSKLNDVAGSIASFEKALQLTPGTSRYANNLATVHFEAGNPVAAYQVLTANNKPAVAHFNMAYLHFKNGEMNEAKKHLDGAIEFESQAASDSIVKRAVDRSREMLAQIDASSAPVAQAAPQATIAGGQFFNGPQSAPVQQTARSEKQSSSPAQSATTAPATRAITPPAAPTYVPSNPAVSVNAAMPAQTTWNRPVASSPAATSVNPTPPASQPSGPAAESKPETSINGAGTSFPFSLPDGFHPQN